MKHLLMIAALLWTIGGVQAQMTSEEAIKRISFIEGKWQGRANALTGPGQNKEIDQHENVELKLGGKIMVIEGKGYHEGSLEFNAFAVVSFDEAAQEYKMLSWLATGQKTEAYLKLGEGKQFEWGFEIPQGKIRYFINLNDKGQWTEKGEFSPNGSTWYPSFNMVLDKK